MKGLSIIYCEANGEGLVMREFTNTIPVVPDVGDRVGLGDVFYKVERRDFVYLENSNTVEVYIFVD
ncbi:hypothetical protein FC756_01540 [Lysinibacillus mangiferihumi]|uniref:Uncharacterized protein n=1 Tax=Lysinibacillus mangiferihumi TaxID=1130819 RepID=A0A4U2ZDK1_9BACI|nr:hypothetical protein [Lysinibacillus mangiferihumi]TKI72488.1 hypothetical protein FC756_01540 [Lysinibacillus mangiferihumi]